MNRRSHACMAALLFAGCEAGPIEPPLDPSVAITPVSLGSARLERDDGTTVEIDALRGRPFLLHFWATWCGPCRRELPALERAAEELAPGSVLAVSVDTDWLVVRRFFDRGVPAFVVRENSGALAQRLGVGTLPDTYLVDREGQAVRRVGHALDWERDEHRRWLADAVEATPRGE